MKIEEGIKQEIEQGIEQGIEKGIERGREEEKLEIARQLVCKSLDTDFIVEVTGLSVDQIEEIQDKFNIK